MLRLTEIKLPLDHTDADLRGAVLAKLGIKGDELLGFAIARRGYDARKRNHIIFIYSLDVALRNEAVILKRFAHDPHVKPKPDTEYQFVAHAPANLTERPVVIGTGPAGFMAVL